MECKAAQAVIRTSVQVGQAVPVALVVCQTVAWEAQVEILTFVQVDREANHKAAWEAQAVWEVQVAQVVTPISGPADQVVRAVLEVKVACQVDRAATRTFVRVAQEVQAVRAASHQVDSPREVTPT